MCAVGAVGACSGSAATAVNPSRASIDSYVPPRVSMRGRSCLSNSARSATPWPSSRTSISRFPPSQPHDTRSRRSSGCTTRPSTAPRTTARRRGRPPRGRPRPPTVVHQLDVDTLRNQPTQFAAQPGERGGRRLLRQLPMPIDRRTQPDQRRRRGLSRGDPGPGIVEVGRAQRREHRLERRRVRPGEFGDGAGPLGGGRPGLGEVGGARRPT